MCIRDSYQRVICAFQPHTYSRTRALFQDFVDELRTVDQAVLTDIYACLLYTSRCV